MVVRSDYDGIKSLLTETVMVLCQNGLKFKKRLSIEGLLCVSLDDEDIVLLKISKEVNTDESDSKPNKKRKTERKRLQSEEFVDLSEDSPVLSEETNVSQNARKDQHKKCVGYKVAQTEIAKSTVCGSDEQTLPQSRVDSATNATRSLYDMNSMQMATETFHIKQELSNMDFELNPPRFSHSASFQQSVQSYPQNEDPPRTPQSNQSQQAFDWASLSCMQDGTFWAGSESTRSRPERVQLAPGMEAVFKVTDKGTNKAVFEGYSHTINRVIGDRTYWRCTDRKCKGRIITCGTSVLGKTEHQHPPSETGNFTVQDMGEESNHVALTSEIHNREHSIDWVSENIPGIGTSKKENICGDTALTGGSKHSTQDQLQTKDLHCQETVVSKTTECHESRNSMPTKQSEHV